MVLDFNTLGRFTPQTLLNQQANPVQGNIQQILLVLTELLKRGQVNQLAGQLANTIYNQPQNDIGNGFNIAQRQADYNLKQVIQSYINSINAAQDPAEAQGYARALADLLSQYGLDANALQNQLTNPFLNGLAARGGANAARYQGGKGSNEEGKKIIRELNDELGIPNKGGNKEIWAERAKTDSRIKIFNKKGEDISALGKIHAGDILQVTSQKYGTVRIEAGGDGEINGNDDKLLSVGTQVAANNVTHGLNQMNNVPTAEENNGNAGTPGQNNNTQATAQDNGASTKKEPEKKQEAATAAA